MAIYAIHIEADGFRSSPYFTRAAVDGLIKYTNLGEDRIEIPIVHIYILIEETTRFELAII